MINGLSGVGLLEGEKVFPDHNHCQGENRWDTGVVAVFLENELGITTELQYNSLCDIGQTNGDRNDCHAL